MRYQTIVGKARRAERDQEGDEEPPFERGCPGAHYQRHAKTVPRCRQWSKANMGSMNNRIAELELEADSMDRKNKNRVLSADELIRSNFIASRLKILYRAQESVWHQKSRIQWCKLGDKNTRFFHLAATTRQKKNQFACLEVDEQILSKPIDVKLAIFNFFSQPILPPEQT